LSGVHNGGFSSAPKGVPETTSHTSYTILPHKFSCTSTLNKKSQHLSVINSHSDHRTPSFQSIAYCAITHSRYRSCCSQHPQTSQGRRLSLHFGSESQTRSGLFTEMHRPLPNHVAIKSIESTHDAISANSELLFSACSFIACALQRFAFRLLLCHTSE